MLRVLAVVMFLSCISVADESNEKTYIFKAKGKFAEELKQLMKKHAQNGDVEITEEKPDYYGTSNSQPQNRSLLSTFLNSDELSGDIKYGKELYNKSCFRCHGKNAEKSSYSTARALNTLSKDELYYALRSYKLDSKFGKSTKMIMRQQTSAMTTTEMVSVSAYIYSLTHSTSQASKPLNDTEQEEEKQGIQGTYLR